MPLGPLEQWRVFLHPASAKVGDRHWKRSGEVLGGAGMANRCPCIAPPGCPGLAEPVAWPGVFTLHAQPRPPTSDAPHQDLQAPRPWQRIEVIISNGW